MTVKQIAERDIKRELRNQCKCFLAFHVELNPVIDRIIRKQIKAQQELSKTNKQ